MEMDSVRHVTKLANFAGMELLIIVLLAMIAI